MPFDYDEFSREINLMLEKGKDINDDDLKHLEENWRHLTLEQLRKISAKFNIHVIDDLLKSDLKDKYADLLNNVKKLVIRGLIDDLVEESNKDTAESSLAIPQILENLVKIINKTPTKALKNLQVLNDNIYSGHIVDYIYQQLTHLKTKLSLRIDDEHKSPFIDLLLQRKELNDPKQVKELTHLNRREKALVEPEVQRFIELLNKYMKYSMSEYIIAKYKGKDGEVELEKLKSFNMGAYNKAIAILKEQDLLSSIKLSDTEQSELASYLVVENSKVLKQYMLDNYRTYHMNTAQRKASRSKINYEVNGLLWKMIVRAADAVYFGGALYNSKKVKKNDEILKYFRPLSFEAGCTAGIQHLIKEEKPDKSNTQLFAEKIKRLFVRVLEFLGRSRNRGASVENETSPQLSSIPTSRGYEGGRGGSGGSSVMPGRAIVSTSPSPSTVDENSITGDSTSHDRPGHDRPGRPPHP